MHVAHTKVGGSPPLVKVFVEPQIGQGERGRLGGSSANYAAGLTSVQRWSQ